MAGNVCPQCGAPVAPGDCECKYCGERLAVRQEAGQQSRQPQPGEWQYEQPRPQGYMHQAYTNGIDSSWPVKSKIVAGLLGIFLGSLGIHKFYLGKIGMGILYLCFSWTLIPGMIGFVEGIIYLCSSDEKFQLMHRVRIVK